MRWTTVMRQSTVKVAATASHQKKRNLKSLALSVYFKQPDLGMKDYEILSRASAFLLGIDAPIPTSKEGPYSHLEAAQRQRDLKEYLRDHTYSNAQGGKKGRPIMDLNWLEFVPKELRPQVHVVASSHVLAPFLWKDYYPQDWLSQVRQEHCSFALEVFDPDKPQEALAKVALNPQPFHHPEGRDLALVHFQDEVASLSLLKKLGVDVLYLRDPDKYYEKGEDLTFDGFVVSERNVADSEDSPSAPNDKKDSNEDDTRVFYPHKETGKLSFHTDDRFFATTPEPLPEGLCGAPVLDKDGDLCGIVEGIVPVTHANKKIAGNAAFMPSYVMKTFVDYVERGLLEKMMPKDLFEMVDMAKKTNALGGMYKKDANGKFTTPSNWEEAYDSALQNLKGRYTQKEVDSFMDIIEDERQQVLDIMDKEDSDMDEVIHRVRQKTLQLREMVRDQMEKSEQGQAIKSTDAQANQK